MRIEHLNLVVRNIEQALVFYRAAFPHWQVRGEGRGDWYGKPRRWLHFGDDHHYLTLNDNGEGSNRELTGHQTGLAHFGIETANLDALTARLLAAGFEISNEGADSPYRKNVYFIDADGFEVEFVQYQSDIPAERNLYSA